MHSNTDLQLIAANGASVALSVDDYQFASGDNWYDSNWLMIAGAVTNSEGTWSFRDPCLLTTEATSLAHWLVRSANRTLEVEPIDFIEPNLAFDRLSFDDEALVLRIEFDLEARPSFADSDTPYVVDLLVHARTCASAGERWLDALGRFPPR